MNGRLCQCVNWGDFLNRTHHRVGPVEENLAPLIISPRAGLQQERRFKGFGTSGSWVGSGLGAGHCEDKEQGQGLGS